MGESVQEDFVGYRCGPLVIFLVLDFIIFAYDKLVQEDQDQNSTALANVLTERQNHNVVQLAKVILILQFLNCLTVLRNVVYYKCLSLVDKLS